MAKSSNTYPPLPPLNWIRAFEAAAKHLSFKLAADELSVTPSAVSQQVKSLEDYYGVKLFQRRTRNLELTRAGVLSAPMIAKALKDIDQACYLIHQSPKRDWLVVTAPLSFCMKWLIPRLDGFHQEHPGVEVHVDASDSLRDLDSGHADIGIRYGKGDYGDLQATRLFSGSYHVVVSPKLLARNGGISELADVFNYPLLHVDWRGNPELVPSWETWLTAAGLEETAAESGHKFPNEVMAIEAAASELGVALVSKANSATDVEEGRLVGVLDNLAMPQPDFHYFLVRGNSDLLPENAALLYNWLCEQAEKSELSVSASSKATS